MARVVVLGAGSWGTALACLLHDNGHEVAVWSINEDEVLMLQKEREHKSKLPGVAISEEIIFTSDLEQVLIDRAVVILAVPSPFVRDTAKKIAHLVPDHQIIVNVAKGIEESTLLLLSEVIQDEIPKADVAALSGPSHAEEVGRKLPTTCVAAAKTEKIAESIQNIFMNPVFRVYTSPDMLGVELGAALKNVIALAAGIADGLKCGDNTKAALITRGITEIARLGMKMGGNMETFAGLSGIGDLIVTCASVHSRNRKAGMLIGQGYTMEEAMKEVKMVVEGVNSAKAALKLGEKYEVQLPIIEQVNKVLFEGQPAQEALTELMVRDRTIEHTNLPW